MALCRSVILLYDGKCHMQNGGREGTVQVSLQSVIRKVKSLICVLGKKAKLVNQGTGREGMSYLVCSQDV